MSRSRAFRPHLETLEDRLTPAHFTWTGMANNGEWADAGNWYRQEGGTGYPDTIEDHADLAGWGGAQYRSYGSNGVGGALGSLSTGGYPSSAGVVLHQNLTLYYGFSWTGGDLEFAGAYTLTLTNGMSSAAWSGGRIGTDDSGGTLLVEDAAELIIAGNYPLNGVTLGVDLVVQDADTSVSVNSTNVTYADDDLTVSVKNNAELAFDGAPLMGGDFVFAQNAEAGAYIKGESNGKITFSSATKQTFRVAIWNAGATIQFHGGSQISFAKGSTETDDRGYYQTSGTTILGTTGGTSTATLICETPGFKMTGGDLKTYSTAVQKIKAGTDAIGNVVFAGGNVKPGADLTGDTDFGYLRIVEGDLLVSGSTTVYVKVSRADTLGRTRLYADNKFTIEGGGSTVNVTAVGAGNRTRWACFQAAANKFSGQFAHVSNGFQLDNSTNTYDYVFIP